jgi:hypothetical protein
MSEATVLDVLTGARELLNIPERWTQQFSARDGEGYPIDPTAPEAVCWCLLGALSCQIEDLTGDRPRENTVLWSDTRHTLYDYLDAEKSISGFNDSHTHEEVVALLDKIIAQEGAKVAT